MVAMIFVWFRMNVYIPICTYTDETTMKPGLKRLVVEMLVEDYKVIKKLAIEKNCTLKVLVIDALDEYILKYGATTQKK